jgi:hypothetical protein
VKVEMEMENVCGCRTSILRAPDLLTALLLLDLVCGGVFLLQHSAVDLLALAKPRGVEACGRVGSTTVYVHTYRENDKLPYL